MTRNRILAAGVAVAAALAVAVLRRPVRPPRDHGTWQPAEPQRTGR